MYNILVVDDEALIRKSILSKLKKYPNAEFKLFEAQNGNEAKIIAEKNILDLIITDIRMGEQTGLELIESIKCSNGHTKYIIISGYSEFSYATNALSLGVIEYLLKPISIEELFNAVKKALDLLEKESSNYRSKQLLKVSDDAFNLAVLLKKQKTISNQELTSYLTQSNSTNALFQEIKFFVDKPSEIIIKLLYKAICQSNFKYGENITLYVDKLRQAGIIFMFKENLSSLNHSQLNLIQIIIDMLESHGMFTFNFAVSERNRDLVESHKQSIFALKHRVILSNTMIIKYQNCLKYDYSYSISKEDRLHFLYLLNSQCYNDISSFIDKISREIGSLKISYSSLEQLFLFFRDAIVSIYKLNLSSDEKSLNIYLFNSFREMFDYIKLLVLDSISKTNTINNKNRIINLVNNLKMFIEENYDENIGLEIFADRNNVNSSFLSSQFHKILGITFQEYLNQVRINRAKELLLNTEYKIGFVAKLCGFSTSHYFSKSFKKYVGQTPSEFKDENKEITPKIEKKMH
jgi:two-component system response regulator YesN